LESADKRSIKPASKSPVVPLVLAFASHHRERGPEPLKIMSTSSVECPPARAQRLDGKYLTFALGCESYGIDVLKVREIIRLIRITAVPQMPDYVRGVINLRGKIIPVTDLRLRFGIPELANTDQTCIIVVQVKLPDSRTAQMGLIVDGVEEVANIAAADIEETPSFGGQICTDYIVGIAKVKGAVKTLLDIDGVVGAGAVKNLAAAAASSTAAQVQ
jgi:purine-binding chemotaxis protein CheW